MFMRGCLFSGARRAAGGFVACCVCVWMVGVFRALKSPSRALPYGGAYWCSLLRITPGSYLQVVTSTGRVVGVKKKGHPR